MANVNYKDNEHNYVVSKPIVLTSVADLLGTNIKDLGRLCTSDKINKWSKHKPVRDTAVCPTYNEAFFSQMSKGLIYGMNVTERGGVLTHAEKMYDSGSGNWDYLKPQGGVPGTGTPYRLGDFNGYNHKASPICSTVDMVKDSVRKIKLGVTENKTPKIRFYVEGIHSTLGSIGFSDIGSGGDAKLVLCANVYAPEGDDCIEIINDNIRLYTTGQSKTLSENASDGSAYDDGADRWKFVDIQLDIPNSGNIYQTAITNKSQAFVYLTLDYVKYYSSEDKWKSERKLVIPYTNDCYYMQEIEIERLTNSLQIQARKIQYGYDQNTPNISQADRILWQGIQEGLAFYEPYFRSPRIQFEVTQIQDAITFGGSNGYRLVCKTKNGSYSVSGKLIGSDGNTLTSQTIPSNTTGTYKSTFVYYDFVDLFPDGVNAYSQNGTTRYYADLYLVNDSKNINMFIGNFSLKLGTN